MRGGVLNIEQWGRPAGILARPLLADDCQPLCVTKHYVTPPVADTPAAPTPVDPVVVEQQRQQRIATLREEREAILAIAGERSLRTKLEQLVKDTAKRFAPPPVYTPLAQKATAKRSRETMVQM